MGECMMVEKIILKILRSNISMVKKEKIVNLYEYNLNDSMYGINIDKTIEYLFDDRLPNNFKKIVVEHMPCIAFKKRQELWEEYYKKYYNEEDLYKEIYPSEFISYAVDKKYGKFIKDKVKAIRSGKLTYEEKKLIIDANDYDYDYVTIYNALDDDMLKDYLIREKINSVSKICVMIHSSEMSCLDKNKIILSKINKDNYLDIFMNVVLDEKDRDMIYNDTREIAREVIENIKRSKLISILKKMNNGKFVKEMLTLRNEDIDVSLKYAGSYECQSFLQYVKSSDIANNVISRNPKKIRKIIHNIDYLGIFDVLNNENLDGELRKEIIILNKKSIRKAIREKGVFSLMVDCLKNDSLVDDEVKKNILKERRNDILEYFKDLDKKEIIYQLNHKNYILELKKLIIDNIIDNEDISFLMKDCNQDVIDLFILSKNDYLRKKIEEYSLEELFIGKMFNSASSNNQLISINKDLIIKRINSIEDEELYKYLKCEKTLEFVKLLILEKIGFVGEDTINFVSLLEYNDCKFLIDNYYKIKNMFDEIEIDFNTFIQYGSGSYKCHDWANRLIDIIDNDKQMFLDVFNYLSNNYYIKYKKNENMVYTISSVLEMILVFKSNYKLLSSISRDNVILTARDIDNLKFVFKKCEDNEVISLDQVDDYRSKVNAFSLKSISCGSILELKNKYLDDLLSGSYECLNNIGGTKTLRMLKNNNSDSVVMVRLIDELIKCSEIIEYGMDTNDLVGLRKILKYYYCDNHDELKYIQDIFASFEDKVRYLFEMDARVNFTSTIQMEELSRDSKLEAKYGGKVYNLSDKNYILYAHVLSNSETVNDIVNGLSTGKKNFISMSAISYMGEKYYYDYGEMIFAFNNIPQNSFICSSISNMGTNYNIRNNSLEVSNISRSQRGILQTSVSRGHNSEILLYRSGVKPVGLVLPGGRKPTNKELMCHNEYGIPFIITQDMKTTVENTQMVFKKNDIVIENDNAEYREQLLNNFMGMINSNLSLGIKMSNKYTGREVAILTDSHALYEPTLAVLENIRRSGIREIYSLGDNVGSGPNPREVIELLNQYGVISIAGNSEYYNTLGVEPFIYLTEERLDNQEWTYDRLGNDLIREIKMYPASIDIIFGNKKIALCHFANDVRWDYRKNSTWTYQSNFNPGVNSRQFLYTNSNEAYNDMNSNIRNRNNLDNSLTGYIDGMREPLFSGKNISAYDSLIQGHVHFEMEDYLGDTKIHTLRAVAMGYKGNEDTKVATYYILKEKNDGGYDIIRKNVEYDRDNMIANINSSNMPGKTRILEFVKAKIK